MNPKFDFVHALTPSFADMLERVRTDTAFPASRRAGAIMSMNRVLGWYTLLAKGSRTAGEATRTPFDGPTLKAIFARLVPRPLGVSPKSVQNAKSEIMFVVRFYRVSKRQSFAPLTEEMRSCCGVVRSQFDLYEVSRLLHYLAGRQVRLADVNQHMFAEFCAALKADWTIKDPEAIGARTRRTWNRLVRKYPSWPQLLLSGGKRKQRWGEPFSTFPEVQRQCLAFLRRGLDNRSDFDGPDADAPVLRPATIFSQMEQYRTAASCLARSGVPIGDISGLRALCIPDHFRRLIRWYIEHLGKANRSVMLLADLLLKTARHAGVLERHEIETVEKLHAKLRKRVAAFEKTKESKGDKLLAQFDDAAIMDALIALGNDTVENVAKSTRHGVMAAYAIQRALTLELMLCAPLRLSNLLNLRLDSHFFWMTVDGTKHLVLRIPAEETKNNRALEHLLHENAAQLFLEYVDRWRPMITQGNSPFLLPGAGGGPKSRQVFRIQMRKYIQKGCGAQFHPHLIRRIVAKLILDDEEGSLEVARRQLGHADNRMLLNVYAQRQNRAMQRRYLQALQERRLVAIERLNGRRRGHAA